MNTHRDLTIFGTVLCDLIAALVAFNLVLCGIFVLSYLASRGADLAACQPDSSGNLDSVACLNSIRASTQPLWVTIITRSALASSATLVIGTAFGVAREMARTRIGNRMLVHVAAGGNGPVRYHGPNRRFGPLDRRRRNQS